MSSRRTFSSDLRNRSDMLKKVCDESSD